MDRGWTGGGQGTFFGELLFCFSINLWGKSVFYRSFTPILERPCPKYSHKIGAEGETLSHILAAKSDDRRKGRTGQKGNSQKSQKGAERNLCLTGNRFKNPFGLFGVGSWDRFGGLLAACVGCSARGVCGVPGGAVRALFCGGVPIAGRGCACVVAACGAPLVCGSWRLRSVLIA